MFSGNKESFFQGDIDQEAVCKFKGKLFLVRRTEGVSLNQPKLT